MKYASVNEIDVKPDEPWFFLRAQDVLAPYAVQTYAAQLRAAAAGLAHAGRSDAMWMARANHLREQAEQCEGVASAMIAWQAQNDVKLPD